MRGAHKFMQVTDGFKALSSDQRAQYDRDGVLSPIRVLASDEALFYRTALEDLETRLGKQQDYAGWCHLYFRWAYDLATHPGVLDVVEDILGPDLLIRATLILCKHPHDPRNVSWHQDGYHSGFDQIPTTSAWIALSDSTSENGCMRVIPGSHKEGALDHVMLESEEALLRKGAEVQVEVDETRARDLVLKAGEMSLHQVHIIHGSNPNRSDRKRVGFIVRFVTPEFRQTNAPVVRARGTADCRHLPLLQEPPSGSVGEGIAAWRAFLRQRNELG